MSFKLFAVGLFTAQVLMVSPALADDTVKRAQELLAALGYKVGTPDGVSGKRTQAALSDVLDKYGQTYDSTLSENEVAFLARVAPAKLRVDFAAAVSELSFLDAADINGDGRLDFVIAPRTDPRAQLGIEVVPANRVNELIASAPSLLYSTSDGFAVLPFPDEGKTNFTTGGRFLFNPQGAYFVLGRNGELGLPDQNRGEKSVIFRITSADNVVTLTKAAQATVPTTTATIELWDFDADGYPEIYENNYNYISTEPKSDSSMIYRFGADEKLRGSDIQIVLDPFKPVNEARLVDVDGNGQVDLIAAAEVQKSYDGTVMQAKTPGSYVLLNPLDKPMAYVEPEYLAPPHFGNDHAGFSVLPFEVGDRTFLLEVSQEFYGHTGGGFQGYYMDAFELLADGTISNVRKQVLPKAPDSKSGGFNQLRAVDIDFDGVNEVSLLMYSKRPQYLDWDGSLFQLRDVPTRDFVKPRDQSVLILLPDPALKCTRAATYLQNVTGAKHVDVHLSACLMIAP